MSYRRPDGLAAVTSANELHLPVGEPVELFLGSADVSHSVWVPNRAGKTDMIPGRVTRMVIQADRPGIYRGQCAEYCGAQHAPNGLRRHRHVVGRVQHLACGSGPSGP
ncbi:MAG TPA: hypothetical protein VNP04_00315 [Alphaproteobacteria bacterium]|nr:hypothetical protein [Alphaproteobacteria bacterium]